MDRNISDLVYKIKLFLSGDLFIVLLILFIGFTSFGLGRLSTLTETRSGIRIQYPDGTILDDSSNRGQAGPPNTNLISETNIIFVASRNGSRYHFPWCSGAQRIKESNIVYFESREDAERAGYTPAKNCEGL